jgi:hypothetical protein
MAAMPTSRRTRMVTAAALVIAIASPAAAKGVFEGTFGSEKFKSKKLFASCFYFRAVSLFSLQGAQGGRKQQKGAIVGGNGADPTAAGAAFPIVLTDTTGSYTSGKPPTPPTWGGVGGLVITLTGYARGKVSGTVTGTLDPLLGGASGPISIDATFSAKCRVQ